MGITADAVIAKLAVQARDLYEAKQAGSVSVLDKATFVAHLVSGNPFIKEYRLLEGTVVMQFGSLSQSEYISLKALYSKDPRYDIPELLALASLRSLYVDGVNYGVIQDHAWTTTRHANTFLLSIGDVQFDLVCKTYSEFECLFSQLLQEADAPSFSKDPTVVATLAAISAGVLTPSTSDGSARWLLAVRLALNFVGKSDVTSDASSISSSEKSIIADKWRKLSQARKL